LKSWKQLGWPVQLILAIVITLIAATTPELFILVDVGGVELAFGYLLIYFQSVRAMFRNGITRIKEELAVIRFVVGQSSLGDTRLFAANGLFSILFIMLSGSSLFWATLYFSGVFVQRLT